MGAVSTGNTQHYQWGDACDGWHLLAAADFSVIEELPAAAHQMRNDSATDLRFIVISAPRSRGDRVAAPLAESAR